MSLYADAEAGLLTQSSLSAYGIDKVDEIHEGTGRTPLIAAIRKCQAGSVELLLKNGASVDKPASDHRTPLYSVMYYLNKRNRAEIVRLLLDADPKPQVDLTYAEVQMDTPLMLAVRRLKDPQIMSMLVDAGADPQKENMYKETPALIAERMGGGSLSRALRHRWLRNAPGTDTVEAVLSLVCHIIGASNTKQLQGLAPGAIQKVFGWSGKYDSTLETEIQGTAAPPQTQMVEEYRDHIMDYVAKTDLGKFFNPEENFLQTVAVKATELQNDDKTPLSKPENVKRLVKLAMYKTLIFCDDSGSMGDVAQINSRAYNQRQLVNRMARVATRIAPDDYGVDLFFIHGAGVKNARQADVDAAMQNNRARGATPLGTVVKQKILDPYVHSVINSEHKEFDRPLLISILTDGEPNHEDADAFERAVGECADALRENGYPDYAVVFQISQIGDDHSAKTFLDGLRARAENDKSLYCTGENIDAKLADNELNLEEWMLKLLVAPIFRAIPEEKEETL